MEKIGGIILCGGQSKRMGRPKATLPFGGEVMRQRVVRILGEVVTPLVVVAAPEQVLPELPAGPRDASRLDGGQADTAGADHRLHEHRRHPVSASLADRRLERLERRIDPADRLPVHTRAQQRPLQRAAAAFELGAKQVRGRARRLAPRQTRRPQAGREGQKRPPGGTRGQDDALGLRFPDRALERALQLCPVHAASTDARNQGGAVAAELGLALSEMKRVPRGQLSHRAPDRARRRYAEQLEIIGQGSAIEAAELTFRIGRHALADLAHAFTSSRFESDPPAARERLTDDMGDLLGFIDISSDHQHVTVSHTPGNSTDDLVFAATSILPDDVGALRRGVDPQIGWRREGDVLASIDQPRDAPMRDAIVLLKDAPHPNIRCRLEVGTADSLACEVFGFADPSSGVDEHEAMAEAAMQEHRDGGEWFAAVAGANLANSDHMGEEEREGLTDFRRLASLARRHQLAVAFAAYEARNYAGVTPVDKDPAT